MNQRWNFAQKALNLQIDWSNFIAATQQNAILARTLRLNRKALAPDGDAE
ncbi:MAG: hypothetical protein AAGE86_00060 [Pseudomonadota bacterium]